MFIKKLKKHSLLLMAFATVLALTNFGISAEEVELTTYRTISERNREIVDSVGRENTEIPWDNTMYDQGYFRHFARYNYYGTGKPIGIVIHEVANDRSTIQDELNYQQRRVDGIFAHAYIDHNQVSQTADFDKMSQAGGPYANPYYLQLEIVRGPEGLRTREDFDKSVANTAKFVSEMMIHYEMGDVTLADNNNGKGSIISHSSVSEFLGGTTHTDPIDWFNINDYNMEEFAQLVKYYIDVATGPKVVDATIKHIVYGVVVEEEIVEGVVDESILNYIEIKDYPGYKFKENKTTSGFKFTEDKENVVEVTYEGIYGKLDTDGPAYTHPIVKSLKDLKNIKDAN